jgi:transmembrane sensor
MSESINSLLARWIAGTLTDAEHEELQRRLTSDPVLRQKVEQVMQRRDVSDLYEAYRRVDVSSARARFFRKHASRLRSSRRVVWRRTVGSVAAMVLLVFGGWLLHFQEAAPLGNHSEEPLAVVRSQSGSVVPTAAVISSIATAPIGTPSIALPSIAALPSVIANTSVDEVAPATVESSDTIVNSHLHDTWLTLADGTRVHLDYQSTLTYPSRFSGRERRVSLRGRAYFIVSHDSRHPFIVDTPEGSVTDYGTEFDVDTDPIVGQGVNVVLMKGSVGVRTPSSKEVLLHPGEKACLLAGAMPRVSDTDLSPYLAWNSGIYNCDRCTLDNLLLVLSRWYHVWFMGNEQALGGLRFTGLITRDSGLDPTLRSIARITGLHITRKEDIVNIEYSIK